MMDHQNIAKVLDAGSTDSGRPYFVMELVQGVPITPVLRRPTPHAPRAAFLSSSSPHLPRHGLNTPIRRGSFTAISSRRTSWVTMYDDKPVPKVIDFGVAKAIEQRLTERTMFTQFGMPWWGRSEYMESRAGGDERVRRGHPQRHLFAGRAALRVLDWHDAARSRESCGRRRCTSWCG